MTEPQIQPAPQPASKKGGTNELKQHIPMLIDAKVAASALGIGERTLWSLTNRDAVPSRRIGRLVRYCPAELRAWIDVGCPTEPGSANRVRKGLRR